MSEILEETRADIRGAALNAFALWLEGRFEDAMKTMHDTFVLGERRERTGSSLKEET